MEIIGIGAILGLVAAAVCVAFYRKGVRDGMGVKKGVAPQKDFAGNFGRAQEGDDEAAAMMKRYETILSYDPYNSSRSTSSFGNTDGERA